MGERDLALLPAQHPCNLVDPVLSGDLSKMRECTPSGDSLADHHLSVCDAGDACKMCYGYDLLCPGQVPDASCKAQGNGASDAGVNLIKHLGLDAVSLGENRLEGKHDTAELTA